MQDYSLHRCTRRCRISNRPLLPGERFYSVIVRANRTPGSEESNALEDEATERYEIAHSHWKGPPEEAIGWWAGKMPLETPVRRRSSTTAELLDHLGRLCDDPSRQALAHLLGLLLLRRRVLQMEDEVAQTQHDHSASPQHIALIHIPTGLQFMIPLAEPVSELIPEVEAELNSLLFTEVSVNEDAGKCDADKNEASSGLNPLGDAA